jgi:hypothetical protein
MQQIGVPDLGSDVIALINAAAAGAVLQSKLIMSEDLGGANATPPTGGGSQLSYPLKNTATRLLSVYIDGICQFSGDYSLSADGTSVVFATALTTGQRIFADYLAK